MFRLSSHELSGRRILVVEAEDEVARRITNEIRQSGGVPLGPVAHIEEALALVRREAGVDCAILDTLHISDLPVAILAAFSENAVELLFVTGHDDWFQPHDF